MRVLQINAVNGISSTGRSSVELADYLNYNNHEAHIAYAGGIAYFKEYKIGSEANRKLHSLLSRITGKQAYFSVRSTHRLLQYISELKPDIVHLRNLHSNFIHLGLLLSFLSEKDIPTVLTLHDCWFFTGKCTHYTVDECYKWQDECGKCPRLKKDNPSWFFDRTKEMLNDKKNWFGMIPRLAVVGVSDWISDEARKSLLSSAKLITRIYNWIDLDVFKPVDTTELRPKLGLQEKYIILGVSSGWSNSKGLDQFIELSGLITEEMVIILVGRMSKRIKLPHNIRHINEIHDVDRLAEYYSLADVLVHFSMEETFGKTIAEANACGTPAVVLNSTACPETLGKDCGIVVNNNKTEEVYEAIKHIQRIGKANYSKVCQTSVRERYNYLSQAKKYLNLYNHLLQ